MLFKVEFLTKNISIVGLDELFLNSELINIVPDMRIKVDGKYVKVEHSAKYKCSIDVDEFLISTQSLQSGITKIVLSYEYSKNKLSSARLFGDFVTKFKELLGKNQTRYSILSDDLSSYFAQKLYPKFQRYESDLRKIFMLALSPLEDENIVETIKKETRNKLDLSKVHTLKNIEHLQIAELHDLIFDLNINRINSISEHFKDFQSKNNDDLKRMISSVLPVTIWEKYFTPFVSGESDDILKRNYNQIRQYRNDVMHFHSLTYKRYIQIDSILSDANIELEKLESNMLRKWDLELTKKLISDLFDPYIWDSVSNISKIVSTAIKPSLDTMAAVNVDLKNMSKMIVSAIPNIQMPNLNLETLDHLHRISDSVKAFNLPENLDEYHRELIEKENK